MPSYYLVLGHPDNTLAGVRDFGYHYWNEDGMYAFSQAVLLDSSVEYQGGVASIVGVATLLDLVGSAGETINCSLHSNGGGGPGSTLATASFATDGPWTIFDAPDPAAPLTPRSLTTVANPVSDVSDAWSIALFGAPIAPIYDQTLWITMYTASGTAAGDASNFLRGTLFDAEAGFSVRGASVGSMSQSIDGPGEYLSYYAGLVYATSDVVDQDGYAYLGLSGYSTMGPFSPPTATGMHSFAQVVG